MAGSSKAGDSADEWSRRLRQRAARLQAQADRIDQGARGERRTAEVLNPRSGDGWYVLHDLAVPGSRANIDHVVVTPAGVFVVDSKDWSGRVSAGKDTLWVGRYPKSRELDTLEWETTAVTSALARDLPGWPITVRAVISLTNGLPAQPVLQARQITAVAVEDLVAHLGSVPARLQPAQVSAIAAAIDAALPSRSGTGSSVVHPAPLPPMPPGPPPGGGPSYPRPGPAGSARPTAGTSRNRPAPATRHRQSAARNRPTIPRALLQLGAGVGAILVGLIALGALGPALEHLHLPTTAAAVPSSPSATSQPGPAALSVSWSCPTPGKGWTATVSWPAVEAPYGTTGVQIAPARSGPWTLTRTGQGPAPIQVTGITGGTTECIRAGNLISLDELGQAIVEGQVTAPAGC